MFPLIQRPPIFGAPGTGFVEDNFSTDGGRGEGQGDGAGCNVSDGELSLLAYLLACCLPPAVCPGFPPTQLRQAGYRAPDPRAAPLIGL